MQGLAAPPGLKTARPAGGLYNPWVRGAPGSTHAPHGCPEPYNFSREARLSFPQAKKSLIFSLA
jgi:hypothetical protein